MNPMPKVDRMDSVLIVTTVKNQAIVSIDELKWQPMNKKKINAKTIAHHFYIKARIMRNL